MRKRIHLNRGPKGKRFFRNVQIYSAIVPALAVIFIAVFNFFFVDQVKNDISKQSIDLERIKVGLQKSSQENANQLLELEKIKVEIAKSAQATAELSASISLSKLDLEKEIAANNKRIEASKLRLSDNSGNRETAKLVNEIAKILNEIRPSVKVYCEYEKKDNSFLVHCNFENLSSNKVTINPVNIQTDDSLGNEINSFEKIENFDSNSILGKSVGSSSYLVRLKPAYAKDLKIYRIKLGFEAVTDPSIVKIAKKLAGGYLSDVELDSAARQGYTFNINF